MQIGLNQTGRMPGNPVTTEYAEGLRQTTASENTGGWNGLREGMVFQAEVQDIVEDKVLLLLGGGETVPARLAGDIRLSAGDQLMFSVKENQASQILIKPLFDSLQTAENRVLEQAVAAAGLSPTERNYTAAKSLLDAGMALDKGNLTKLLSQSMKFEGTSMQTLTALNRLEIPVTEQSIAQYERYEQGIHSITSDLQNTVQDIVAFSDGIQQEGTALLQIAEQIFTVFENDMEKMARLQPETELPIPDEEPGETVQTEHADISEAGQDNFVRTSSGDSMNPALETVKQSDYNGQTTASGLQTQFAKELLNLIPDSSADKNQILQKLETADTPEQQIQVLREALQSIDAAPDKIARFFQSEPFRAAFAKTIENSWALHPEQMKDPHEIDRLYEKIQKQGRELSDIFGNSGNEMKDFQQDFQNARQNMQFMEQLNHQLVYAQMPLRLSEQNTNSELYVYADKRRLLNKKDGISVMLHLDLDHLGATDVKVSLTGDKVHARFYLKDEEAVNLVQSNMKELSDALKLRGFSLSDEVIQRKPSDSVNQVIDEVIDSNAEKSVKRYTFDART